MVKGRILASEWIFLGGGIGRLNQRPDNSSGHTVLAGHGVCPFMFFGGLFAGLLKRVAGVEGGKRSARTFLWIFLAVRSSKESSKSRAITAKVCESHTRFSWNRGFAADESCRSISFPLLSIFGNTEGRGFGRGARTRAARVGVPD